MNELKWSNEGGMIKEEKQFKKKIYQFFAPDKIFIRPICYFFADLVRFVWRLAFSKKKKFPTNVRSLFICPVICLY